MATTPARRSRRSVAPIGSRPPGRRRRPRAALPAAQPVAAPPADRWTRIQQAVGTLAALGTLAVIAFTWLSIQQVDDEHALTREGQVTDRYNNAVTNLADKALEVRLGGVYALQRIMEDSPRDQPSIVDVLSTYIRQHAAQRKGSGFRFEPDSDVQAALSALGARNPVHDGTGQVNLNRSVLTGANLTKANLRGAYLISTNLSGASLRGADLRDAILASNRTDLSTADLRGADLRNANLSASIFNQADLRGADLRGAGLDGGATLRWALLGGADLRRAEVTYADLRHAKLQGANMAGTDLGGSDLRGADLRGVDLRSADLTGVDLRGADLADADLRSANLTDADLRGAYLRGAKR